MRNLFGSFLAAFLLASTHAGDEFEFPEISRAAAFLAPNESPAPRQYAPDREIEIRRLSLDVTPDFKARTVAGTATLVFSPIARPLPELRLDAVDLAIASVTGSEKIQDFQVTGKNLIITFASPIPAGRESRVTITYSAEPRLGLYFRTPEMGYPAGDMQVWSQGESTEARHWYPCYDFPNAKFSSEITCHVPSGMTALSNGKLVSQETDARGLVAFHWLQEKPHVNYLVALVAGYLTKIEDRHRDIPLALYTAPSDAPQAKNSFADTRDIMAFFEKEIGYNFPWPKYDQACVLDFHWGGMENTSLTTLTDRTLFKSETENIRSSQSLVAHEMAHQWFGDLVTCKDWSHAWLNEGFATYYARLYEGAKNGHAAFLYSSIGSRRSILERFNDTRGIVTRKFREPEDQFAAYGYLAYGKGSWVLQMLRAQLGDDLFRHSIKAYLEAHQFGNVTTDDLLQVLEKTSGRSFDQFFDQWVYHAHHPELDVDYSWDENSHQARVSIRQTQKLSDDILLFDFPLTIRFKGKFGVTDRTAHVKEAGQDFSFPLESPPVTVSLDPEASLLAKFNFNPPAAMLHQQLLDADDVAGRLFALEKLERRNDHETIRRIQAALNSDKFYGVRIEAARALQSIHNPEALAALIASRSQADARVRDQVIASIGRFYDQTALAALRETLDREKNPDIRAQAIRGLGSYPNSETRPTLLALLDSQSYRNSLVDSAIGAMKSQADPLYLAPLRDSLRRREADLTSATMVRGFDALASIARLQDNKDETRQFLVSYVNHPRETIRRGALTALGTLRDMKAVTLLESFASAGKESSDQAFAERALTALRDTAKPADPNLPDLRREVLDLQKENRDLRRDFDLLKKKLETPAKRK